MDELILLIFFFNCSVFVRKKKKKKSQILKKKKINMASATSELKTYLDQCCVELKLKPVSDDTIKILEDNEIDETILYTLTEAALTEMKVAVGSKLKLLEISKAEKANRDVAVSSSARSDTFSSISPASPINSVQEAHNSQIQNQDINNNNNNSNHRTKVRAVHFSTDTTDVETDPELQRAILHSIKDSNNHQQPNNNRPPNGNDDNCDQISSTTAISTLLQPLTDAKTPADFLSAANKIENSEKLLGKFKSFFDLVASKSELMDQDEAVSERVGFFLSCDRFDGCSDEDSEVFERVFDVAYHRISKSTNDVTKIMWLSAVWSCWFSNVRAIENGERLDYHPFASKFAPFALDLMKKTEEFDPSFETGIKDEEEGLLRVALTWQTIAIIDGSFLDFTEKQGGIFRPLFDFRALQILLHAGAHRTKKQKALAAILEAADRVTQLLPGSSFDLRVIADSIHLCIEKATSIEAVEDLVRFLHQLYFRHSIRAQMGKHLRLEEIISKLKHPSLQNQKLREKSNEMLPHFEEVHRENLKESIKNRFNAVNIPISLILLNVLVRSNDIDIDNTQTATVIPTVVVVPSSSNNNKKPRSNVKNENNKNNPFDNKFYKIHVVKKFNASSSDDDDDSDSEAKDNKEIPLPHLNSKNPSTLLTHGKSVMDNIFLYMMSRIPPSGVRRAATATLDEEE